jgi:hypothetical protein
MALATCTGATPVDASCRGRHVDACRPSKNPSRTMYTRARPGFDLTSSMALSHWYEASAKLSSDGPFPTTMVLALAVSLETKFDEEFLVR